MLEKSQFTMNFNTQLKNGKKQKYMKQCKSSETNRNYQSSLKKSKQYLDKESAIIGSSNSQQRPRRLKKKVSKQNIQMSSLQSKLSLKQELLKHINHKQVEKRKVDITNPEDLSTMQQQLLSQQIQQQLSLEDTQLSLMMQQQHEITMQFMPDIVRIVNHYMNSQNNNNKLKILSQKQKKEQDRIKSEIKEMRDKESSTVINLELKYYQILIINEEQMQYFQCYKKI
ncbi:unnamed protein product (macronuclear) [Paramecium tetraurelia]|uniref:Uncharacterized protein n=1 Tax=Paramecium tetraurelia TaxID=5888 RepID=A0BMN3_PARTE|nr:uncharacterized protein GSPATT00030436001 [Paramecium tetraurelia]CAK59800.1 unnamed protein product [Paramecium tetraurelia]|eukprot:XP_001427198.1 hypothetical protein (macronuclear) [Paramecium tetraurelia strain d4-2]